MARITHQDAFFAAQSAQRYCDFLVAELTRTLLAVISTHGVSYLTDTVFANVEAYNTCATLINASSLDVNLPILEDPESPDELVQDQNAASPVAEAPEEDADGSDEGEGDDSDEKAAADSDDEMATGA